MISMYFQLFRASILFWYFFCILLIFKLFAAVPVATFDGAGVDIVASLHLSDGTMMSCFVLVVSFSMH